MSNSSFPFATSSFPSPTGEATGVDPKLFIWALLSIGSVVLFLDAHAKRNGPLPPGPKGLPFFGNVFQLSEDAWHRFTEWKHIYGPIVYLNLCGQSVIVLSSNKVASDLLDRRAAIYSDRPRFIVACGMLTEGLFFTFSRYGDKWRRMRRAAHTGLHKVVVNIFQPQQTAEATLLIKDIIKDPSAWDAHVRRSIFSTVLNVTYDTPVITSMKDDKIEGILRFTKHILRAAYIDGHMVEYFPWLQHLPSWIARWKKDVERWSWEYSKMFQGFYGSVKQRAIQGDERPSFAFSLHEKRASYGLTEKEMAWLSATIAAGSESVVGVTAWFMLAIVRNPDIQRKAQAEIDDVVGRDRLPTFADYEHLPYIRALVREVLRWNPVDPLGMQHRSTHDDWYGGYFIPAGTICIANVWAMNRDPEIWGTDAHEFKPERHLNAQGGLAKAPADTRDEGHVTFGFGRRICVGRHLANNSLFINIAYMLWMFSIDPVLGEDRKPIIPTDESLNLGLVVRPRPFDCVITPRHPDALATFEHHKLNYGL